MLSNLIAFNWIGFSTYGSVHVNNSIRQLFSLIQQFSLYMHKITSSPLICTMNLNDRRRFFRCLHHSDLGHHLLNECQVENLKFISIGFFWNTNFIQFKTVTKQNHAACTTQYKNHNLTFRTEPAWYISSKICYLTKMPSHVMRFIYLLFRFNCANPFIMVVLGTVFTHTYCVLNWHPFNFERTNNKLGIVNRMVFRQLMVYYTMTCTVNVLHCSIG